MAIAIAMHSVYTRIMNAQYVLLSFLADESNYGYELKKKYDSYFGKDKPILPGQIYSSLARLKRDNKIKPAPQLQATMYVKTVLAILMDGDAAPYLDNQRRAHIQKMRSLTDERRNSNLSDMLLIDHALYHLEADLRWIELTISRLKKLKEELSHGRSDH